MKNSFTTYAGFTVEEAKLLESIIRADALTDVQLAELEGLLERKGDAALELPQLRLLRQACERMRLLLDRCEKMPVGRVAASR